MLKYEADLLIANLGQFIIGKLADIQPVKPVASFIGDIKTAEHIHQGRFAGAGRPDNSNEFSMINVKGNIP
ncbi:hypothetical protein D3C77_707400 [compost metagenome]